MNHLILKLLNFLSSGRWTSDELPPAPVNKFFQWIDHKCALAPIVVSEHESIARSPLFTKLPPELRLKICEYALYTPDDEGFCVVTKKDGIPEPPLLFTCNTICGEAISSFYSVNNFHNIVELLHPATIVLTLRKKISLLAQGVRVKGRTDNILSYNSLRTLRRLPWPNLRLWLEYVHAGECACPDLHRFEEILHKAKLDTIVSMFKIASGLQAKPWSEVEQIMDGLYGGLMAAYNFQW
jgi:hypothetical protein